MKMNSNQMKNARAGTLESGDVLVRIEPADSLEIKLHSPVINQFGEAILRSVRDVLDLFGVTSGTITLEDQGALDCTIRARLTTAIRRSLEGEEGVSP
ncbi:MAG TPA: citrate lyase acyl carrier protein [Clostridiaceae bacterium]|jgi:citrate lyase subunit gamma (acyl carrier protein)|nr:citrate lyase acyl carrier protein [Clostridiaceae bacterium]